MRLFDLNSEVEHAGGWYSAGRNLFTITPERRADHDLVARAEDYVARGFSFPSQPVEEPRAGKV